MTSCKAINRRGQPCGARTLRGSDYCYMHDPTRGEERAQARKRGGLRRRPDHGLMDIVPGKVRSLDDVLAVLDYALSESMPLENSVQRGRLIVAIANAFIAAIKTGELESRILAIESALKARELQK